MGLRSLLRGEPSNDSPPRGCRPHRVGHIFCVSSAQILAASDGRRNAGSTSSHVTAAIVPTKRWSPARAATEIAMARLIEEKTGAFNIAGRVSLLELLAWVAGARAVITNDTMAAHLGASCNRPTLIVANGVKLQSFHGLRGSWHPRCRNGLPAQVQSPPSTPRQHRMSLRGCRHCRHRVD